jgi:site-specific recombinase XerD
MLTTYLKTPLTLARYRIGPAGPHLDRFTEWLEARGYQPDRVLHLLRGVHRFSCWAHRAGLPVQGLGAEAIEAFRHHLHTAQRLHYPSGNYSHLFMGARHFVAFLAATGQLTAPALIPTGSSEPPLLVEFRHWMSTHRGTTAATVHNYRLPLRDFLAALGEQPAQYTAQALRAFILEQAQRYGSGRAKTVVTAVRMFLRFLIAVGHCAPGLEHAIPTIARWRRASLPTYLSAEAVERVIASCDLTTPMGTRDRAVLLLLARLALRAGDVTALQFRHLDWEGSTVQVAGKSRRHYRLPLPQEVGDAILHYLDYRPTVPTDQVFLTTRAPFKRLSYQAVGKIATQAMARAGTETPIHGSHVLRHSAATQMLRAGFPLSAIGVVLRHASMETTAGYAKVDVPLLQAVVQPWPEGTSC